MKHRWTRGNHWFTCIMFYPWQFDVILFPPYWCCLELTDQLLIHCLAQIFDHHPLNSHFLALPPGSDMDYVMLYYVFTI